MDFPDLSGKIPAIRSGNFLKFPLTDLTIIFYCRIRTRQFLKNPALT